MVTHLTNTMLLHSLAGARTLMGAASWASSTLIGALKEDTRFPVNVRTHCGASLTLSVVRFFILSLMCHCLITELADREDMPCDQGSLV